MSAAQRPALAKLAKRLGIVARFTDLTGVERPTRDATRVALCSAMGLACASESEAATSLGSLDAEMRARVIEPVRVWREHARGGPGLRVIPPASFKPIDAELEIALEDGSSLRRALRLPASDGTRSFELALPLRPPMGVHRLRLRLPAGDGARGLEQVLIVAPRSALRTSERLGDERLAGLWANLYTVRSQRGFGFGDFGDLARLAAFAGERDAGFVALNPLHALYGRGNAIAPYSPMSRIWQNVAYLDVEAVPELLDCVAARARLEALPLAALRASANLEHERVLDAKLEVLRALHACFARREQANPTERGRAFAEFRARGGEALADFTCFEALQKQLGAPDWRRWPQGYRDPRSNEVRAFASTHADELEFRAFLQFELDRQLARAADTGREAGLALGLVKDLAVGSASDSADVWANPGLFAHGASLGAPPDAYAADGQNWGLPPLVPHRQRTDGYAYLRRVLQAAFRSAGALRIDHVMGLARLYWIPAGRPGNEGAYVRQAQAELFGILALESRRAGALVVGEDLGTVPPELGPELASWGILSTRVLFFERNADGFRPSAEYPARALVLATTHDLPPLVGYLAGRDLEIRRKLGGIASDEELKSALAEREAERAALIVRLRAEGDLPPDDAPVDDAALIRAVHVFLSRTPSRLRAISLDDLAGENEPLNLPGVPVERHRSWTRRMKRTLEDLAADPGIRAAFGSR